MNWSNRNEWMSGAYYWHIWRQFGATMLGHGHCQTNLLICNYNLQFDGLTRRPNAWHYWMKWMNEKELPSLHFTLYGHEWTLNMFLWWIRAVECGANSTVHTFPTNEQITFSHFHFCSLLPACLPARHSYSICIFFFLSRLSKVSWFPFEWRKRRGKKYAGKATKKRNSCSNESVYAQPSSSTPVNDNNVNEWLRVPRSRQQQQQQRWRIERQRKIWIRRKTFLCT